MIVDDPAVTVEYEAIAAALRPHGGHNDRLEDLTWQQVVGIAAAAVAPTVAGLRDRVAACEAECVRVASEASDVTEATMRAAQELVSSMTDALANRIAELEGRADWWRLESEKNGARLVVLEALRVQAEARWGHEGGPSPLREALDAARPTDGD